MGVNLPLFAYKKYKKISFFIFKKRIKKNMEILNLKNSYKKYCNGFYNHEMAQTESRPSVMHRNVCPSRLAFDSDTSIDDLAWLEWNIRRRGSHIYFYEEINPTTQMILEVMLRDAVRDVLTSHVGEILGGELPESVTIHLNSPGGYLSCGLAIYDYIKTSQVPITCLVEGICASAATLVMLACHNRIMSPNSVYLMHQCSWGAWGDNRFMQDLATNADKSMKRIRKIYLDETKIAEDRSPQEREAYIQHLLEHDFELSAEECEQFGICTACDDDDEVELSDERMEKLQSFIKKLAVEQKKENQKKEAEEKELAMKKPDDKKPSKKTPKAKESKLEEAKTTESSEPEKPKAKESKKPKTKPEDSKSEKVD